MNTHAVYTGMQIAVRATILVMVGELVGSRGTGAICMQSIHRHYAQPTFVPETGDSAVILRLLVRWARHQNRGWGGIHVHSLKYKRDSLCNASGSPM